MDTRPKPPWRFHLNAGLTMSQVEGLQGASSELDGVGFTVSPGAERRLGRILALKGRVAVTASRFTADSTLVEVESTLGYAFVADLALRIGRPDGVFAGGPYLGAGFRHWDKAQLNGVDNTFSQTRVVQWRTENVRGPFATLGLQGRVRFGRFEVEGRVGVQIDIDATGGSTGPVASDLRGVSASLLPGYTFE